MEVVVIGAGISGLSAARMLEERGHTVTIFEGSGKPGGLIRCDIVSGGLFHRVGGHIFNTKIDRVARWFWSKFDRDKEFIKALMEESSYEVSNVEITLVTQTYDAAVVEVSYHLRSNVMAMFWEEDLQETAQLTKVDDKWLIVQMR